MTWNETNKQKRHHFEGRTKQGQQYQWDSATDRYSLVQVTMCFPVASYVKFLSHSGMQNNGLLSIPIAIPGTVSKLHGKEEWKLQMEFKLLIRWPQDGEIVPDYPNVITSSQCSTYFNINDSLSHVIIQERGQKRNPEWCNVTRTRHAMANFSGGRWRMGGTSRR